MKQNTPPTKQKSIGWNPRQIRVAMLMAGVDSASIGKASGMSHAAISYTWRGLRQGLRARQAIADALHIPVTEIWPDALLPVRERRLLRMAS